MSDKVADDFQRAGSMVGSRQNSMSRTMSMSQKKAANDPYHLDFTQLRKDYVHETTIQIPFVKSSFIHYSKCPRNMVINGKEYKDLVLTMELGQSPSTLDYQKLDDPVKVKEQEKARKKEEKRQQKLAELKRARMAIKAEKQKEKEAAKQIKLMEREKRREEREKFRQAGVLGSDDEDETEEDEDDDDDEEDSDIDEDEIVVTEDEDEENEASEQSSGGGSSGSGGSEDDDSDSGTGEEDGQDREYTGDMFDVTPVKFLAGPMESTGMYNAKTGTNDFCTVAIWSTGGQRMRYTRLKDTTLRMPPLAGDKQFRVGHDAKRIFYVGELDGVKQLCIIYLKDLSHKYIKLGKHANQINTLQDASLFKHYLCYRLTEKIEKKIRNKKCQKEIKNFYVFDLKKQEIVWELPDCEQILFAGKNAQDLDMVDYKERIVKLRLDEESSSEDEAEQEDEGIQIRDEDSEDIDSDGGSLENCHKGILVIKTSEEEQTVEAEKPKEGEAEAKEAADKEEGNEKKKKTFKYYRCYMPQWRHKIKKKRCVWETSFEVKPAAASTKAAEPVMAATDEFGETPMGQAQLPMVEENEMLVTSDHEGAILALIIKGIKGEQHKVVMFNPEKKAPLSIVNRAGNTDLEFNMNSHLRPFTQIFICQTEANDQVTAKRLNFDPNGESGEDNAALPPISFTGAQRGFGKDCWCVDREEENSIPYIMTICKSSTDEYLNADCAVSEKIADKEGANAFKTVLYSAKIKCQEIDVNYPCLVSNIGLSLVTIQSLTNPHTVATFNLEQQGMDFICFADYQNNADIGFKDKREPGQQETIPFNETADNIAFLTRKRGKNEDGEDKEFFDILLNVLSIDSYSRPMKFMLYTTEYDAYMGEGMSDDTIQKCIVSQVTSARGLDVAFIAQYNDRIIYDCITSTKQLPIRFPLPALKEQEEDPDFNKDDCEFEQLDVCKGGEVVRQNMIMDKDGAIYFMTKASNGTVKVLRTNPMVEMGDDQFIKTVYTLRSSKIYFLLFADHKFYIMDDTKKVRVLVPNAETFNWKLTQTLELCEKDQYGIVYSDFDEWTVSDGVLHGNDRLYYFLTSSNQDNPTWASEQIMLENHLHISGPRYAKESGLIWYMQKHTLSKEDEVTAEAHDELMQDDHLHGKVGHSAHGHIAHRHFRGYSIVMQPLGDLSYMDILPQRGENHNNYITFISEHYLLANFGGRFLVFDLKGHFQGPVQFMNMSDGFRGEALKLVNVSDSGKFFVFKGPRFLTKAEREANKAKKMANKQNKQNRQQKNKGGKRNGGGGGGGNKQFDENALEKKAQKALKRAEQFKSGGPKAPIFYIFKLETRNSFAHGMEWRFLPYKTALFPFVEDLMSLQTTQRINYQGLLSQCSVKHSVDQSNNKKRVLEILVKNFKSEDLQPPVVAEEQSFFSRFSVAAPENPFSEEKYYMKFDPISRAQKHAVIQRKVQAEQKRILMGSGSKDALIRLQRREGQIDRAWIFNNYIVAKSGSEIKYIKRSESVLGMHQTNDIKFSITPGAEVWIENVISTGVNDLVQLFIVDDVNHRLFVITWNLQFNREHSLFQSTYAEDVFPENLIMRGKAYNKQQDFNYFLDNGAVINLDTNLPVQFFDIENEADTMPKGPLHAQVEGMVRISTDRSRYLDMTAPGRVHHFISFCDLLYWERFEHLREKHEINKGIITSFSPIARFPKGISIFHYFATNAKVLSAVEEQMTIARQDSVDDVRLSMLPLVFLHSNPQLNKVGKKTTPIHIALDKQSPISFETMFQMLIDQHKVCVTSQLLDMLDTIIDSPSQSVLDFFDQSFYITDQFSGLRALEWEDAESDEKIIAIPSAYLTDEFMQSLVSSAEPEMEEVEEHYYDDDEMFMDQELMKHDDGLDAPCDYSSEVEPQTHVADDSNLKQIEAKILDFNWVFIGDNSARLISTLAQTENDGIFACSQIRVFIDFMWEGYYAAIFNQLFLPFVFYFASFVLYTCYFSHHENNQLGPQFIAEIVCLVILGKTFVTFVILELIQIRNAGLGYFFDVWNLVDVLSLGLNAFYVYCEITNVISHQDLQLVASVATLLLWFKLFYWMRLFKPFSAFIRMITEIIKDIQVFMVMLIIALMSFANVIFILNLNREENGCGDSEECGPIYENLVGVPPIDALIHSYLTGLGEFGKDNYSMENAWTVWVMFILATLIVQLVFMNLLIAIMGDSFSRINEIMDQSTLKELCGIMEDHFWLQKIEELFESKRYILWLTPDTSTSGGTAVERQITQLKEQIKNNSEAQEQKIVRKIDGLAEDVAALKSLIEEASKKEEDEDEF